MNSGPLLDGVLTKMPLSNHICLTLGQWFWAAQDLEVIWLHRNGVSRAIWRAEWRIGCNYGVRAITQSGLERLALPNLRNCGWQLRLSLLKTPCTFHGPWAALGLVLCTAHGPLVERSGIWLWSESWKCSPSYVRLCCFPEMSVCLVTLKDNGCKLWGVKAFMGVGGGGNGKICTFIIP